jgi:hypothetical protein
MYSWLWSKLPGGKIAKALVAALSLSAVIFALFAWGFPALDLWFAQNPVVSD